MRKKFLASLLLLIFGIFLVSCKDTTEKFTVTFNTNGGSPIASVEVEDGSLLDEPTEPTRDGFEFDGWFKEASLATLWQFASDTVTSDITIYAKWRDVEVTPTKVSVTFDFNFSGSSAPVVNEYNKDSVITNAPEVPEREDFEFLGWSTSRTTFTEFTLTTPVTTNITLYAFWQSTKTEYTVTLDFGYDSKTEEVVVLDGDLLEIDEPERANYIFLGWTLNGESFDLETAITANITLKANWIEDIPGMEGTAIATPQQLLDLFTNGGDGDYYLVTDIDMSGIEFGGSQAGFSGTLNGNDKRLLNFNVVLEASSNKSGAMFGFLHGATIKNLRIMRSSITSATEGLGFVAYSASAGTTFENLTFINVGVVSTGNYAALLYADNADTTVGVEPVVIKNIVVNNNITTFIQAGRYVGGLVGYIRQEQNLNFENIFFNGQVKSLDSTAGALVSRLNSADTTINIKDVVVNGLVEAFESKNYVGGLVGEANVAATINATSVLFDNATVRSGGGSYGIIAGRRHDNLTINETDIFYTENFKFFSHNTTDRLDTLDADGLVEVTNEWFTASEFNKDFFKFEENTLVHTVDLGPVVAEGLSIDANSYNDIFVKGVDVELDLESIKVYVSYSDGQVKLLEFADLTIDKTGFDPTITGDYDISITAEGLTAEITITVVEIEELVAYDVDIDKLFLEGETPSLNNLIIKAVLEDGSELLLNHDDLEFVLPTAVGEQNVVVTYKDEYSVNVPITIVAAQLVASDDYIKVVVDQAFTGVSGSEDNGFVTVKTVQEAIDLIAKSGLDATVLKEVYIKKGVYFEKLRVATPNMLFVGEDREEVVIDYDVASGTLKPGGGAWGTQGSATFTISSGAKGFTAYNLTFSNSFDFFNSTIGNKQGVALVNEADQALFYQVSFLGHQDTLYAKNGRQWYLDIYVEGTVDFVFGNGGPAYFENSEFKSIARETGAVSAPKGTGPSESDLLDYGYVFYNNVFTFEEGTPAGSVDLGRPWGKDALAAFINNEFGVHISDRGYVEMSGNSVANARFFEFGNMRDGVAYESTDGTQLTAEAAALHQNKDVVFDTNNGAVTFTETWNYLKQLSIVAPELVATVTVDENNDSDLSKYYILVGQTLDELETPTKAGFDFLGWFVGDEEFDFDTEISADVTIVAKWEAITSGFTVTFKDGDTVLEEVLVAEGSTVTKIADPNKAGFIFDGWLLAGVAFDFDTPITADITLDAQWIEYTAIGTPITSPQQFIDLFSAEQNGEYYLANDLDFTGLTFETTGDGPSFKGVFDGNFKTIRNLTTSQGSRGGLFPSSNGATIKNLTLDNVTVVATGRAGILVGRVENNLVTVTNVTVINSSVTGNDNNGVGGLIGQVSNAANLSKIVVKNTDVINIAKNSAGLVGRIDDANGNLVASEILIDGIYVEASSGEGDRGGALVVGYIANNDGVTGSLTDVVVINSDIKEDTTRGVLIGYYRSPGVMTFTNVYVDVQLTEGTIKSGLQGHGVNEHLIDVSSVYGRLTNDRSGNGTVAMLEENMISEDDDLLTFLEENLPTIANNPFFSSIFEVREYVTVTIDLADGSTETTRQVEVGKTLSISNPTRENYEFKGWLLNGVSFDLNTPITENITLVASWEALPEVYTVTFKDGETVLSTQEVTEGNIATKPDDLEKPGFNFLGWFVDDVEFNFETEINANVTILAKWEEITTGFTITFMSDGEQLSSFMVPSGELATPIANPVKPGFDFLGWFVDDVEFNFNEPITADVIVVAKWEEASDVPNGTAISTVAEFLDFLKQSSGEYYLANDIDFEGLELLLANDERKTFTGTLDGNWKTISNLVRTTDRGGLFRSIKGATFKNITFYNVDMIGENRAGMIAGEAPKDAPISYLENITIINSKVSGAHQNGVGSLLGMAQANVEVNNIKVINTEIKNSANVAGGIFGQIDGNNAAYQLNISNVLIIDTNIEATNRVGGVYGESKNGAVIAVSNVVILNTTMTGTENVAGIGGYHNVGNTGTVTNVLIDGSISGNKIAHIVAEKTIASHENVFVNLTVTGTTNGTMADPENVLSATPDEAWLYANLPTIANNPFFEALFDSENF